MVVSMIYETSVLVLLNAGDGTFSNYDDYGIDGFSYSVALADLNGDNAIDMAVANFDSYNDKLSILLNNGDGTFHHGVDCNTGTVPFSVALGDLNGDDFIDAAVANNDSNDVSILMNNGQGNFSSPVTYPVGVSP